MKALELAKRLISLSLVCPLAHISPVHASSGGNVGNGGVGVFCPTAHESSTLEFFDLYEGRVLQSLTPVETDENYKDRAASYAAKLDQLLPGADNQSSTDSFSFSFKDRAQAIMGMLKLLPSGVGLTPTGDVESIIYPKSCEVKQIINYKNDGFIYVDSDLWSLLSASGKTAAVLHELIYEYFRAPFSISDTNLANGDHTSVRARRATALLLAGRSLEKVLLAKRPDDYSKQWHCRTYEAEREGRPTTEFYVTSVGGGTQVIEFTKLNGRLMLSHASLTWLGSFETIALRQRVESLIDWDLEVELRNIGDSGTPVFEIGIIDGNQRSKEKLVCTH
jgi:hypothetical protein